MRARSGARLVLLLSAVPLVACTGHSNSNSTFSDGTPWSITDCDDGGSADMGLDTNPHAATQQQAVAGFLAHGKTLGLLPANESTVQAGVPATGWHIRSHKQNSAVFQSGKDLLLVRRVGNAWTVSDVALCLKAHVPTYEITS
jgi:hypothetical protein